MRSEILLTKGMVPPTIQQFTLRSDQLKDFLSDHLVGKVFHFTSQRAWESIQLAKCVLPNRDGAFKNTSTQSDHSAGKFLDAVCLFDLRNKTPSQIDHGLSLYNFLHPWRDGSPNFYLILKAEAHRHLITIEELDPFVRETKMYIPGIESWFPTDLPMSFLEAVYEVKLIQPPA